MFGRAELQKEIAAARGDVRDLRERTEAYTARLREIFAVELGNARAEIAAINRGEIGARDFRRTMAKDILQRLDPPKALAELPTLATWVETGEWPKAPDIAAACEAAGVKPIETGTDEAFRSMAKGTKPTPARKRTR
jgi:hypothetical protein